MPTNNYQSIAHSIRQKIHYRLRFANPFSMLPPPPSEGAFDKTVLGRLYFIIGVGRLFPIDKKTNYFVEKYRNMAMEQDIWMKVLS